ncbi:HD domain-containing protein [Terriglobus saanensis]|nr:HD domain-containing protein [Terriglobus saanensis]
MHTLVSRVRNHVLWHLEIPGQSVAHRIDHLDRVLANARRIAATQSGIDEELLELATLLHDVNQPVGKKTEHVRLSMGTAIEILRTEGCPEARIDRVVQIISEHSTENMQSSQFTSQEARILFDADKLDGLGAVGIARVFALYGQMGLPLQEAITWYRGKIAVASEHLQTEEGIRLCRARFPYVQDFLTQLEAQLRGEDPARS